MAANSGVRSSAVTPTSLRVVRASPGLVWRALDGHEVIGAVSAFLRPDDRWFVWFDSCRADAHAPLLAAVADNVRSDLYVTAEEADEEALDRFTQLGFTVSRREGNYLIPTDPLVTGLQGARASEQITVISAMNADEDELRWLDQTLRQDVPGTGGWVWDPGDFHEETFDSQFDPATYLVAVDSSRCDYIGLVRIWNSPGRPRLGLIAVLGPYRRRGLARALLAQALGVLQERGKSEVTAEVDDTNTASISLLASLGARRRGGSVEMIKSLSEVAK
jgi:GNAT superfamily N-acetyltransferase